MTFTSTPTADPWLAASRPPLTFSRVGLGAASMVISFFLFFFIWIPTVALLAAGVGLVPAFGLGLVILWVLLALLRFVLDGERGRARAVYGLAIPPLFVPRYGPQDSWWRRTFGPYLTAEYWRSVAHLLIKLFLGLIGTATVTVLFSLGAGTWFTRRGTEAFQFAFGITTPLGSARIIGIVLVLAAAAALWAFVALDRALDIAMLDRSEDVLRHEVSSLADANVAAERAAATERARIERDLHDGAQPRLVNLAMTLGMAKAKMKSDPETARAMLEEAHSEAKSAVTDLRQIARGFHPAILTDRGLDAAVSALAASSPIPTRVKVDLPERPPRAVESVAYFVVAEAITNATKHSGASRVDVVVTQDGPYLRITVIDDGRGGARVTPGPEHTGLAGLEQRVRAARGTFSLTSPAGGPTILTVELPCA